MRPVGVTLTAYLAMFGSVLVGLLGIALLTASPQRPIGIVSSALALAAWGAITAAGLFRMRRWSRFSILVLAALLTAGGSLLALASTMPLPEIPGETPLSDTERVAFTTICGALAAIGFVWLIYFLRESTRDRFNGPVVAWSRPLSISVIGWIYFAFAAIAMAGFVSGGPATLLTLNVQGWAARALDIAWTAAYIGTGIGLLRLRPWSRLAALGLCLYGSIENVLYLAVPSVRQTYWGLAGEGGPSATTKQVMTGVAIAILVLDLMFAWHLTQQRDAFGKRADGATAQ